jgi:predicted ATPase
MRLHHTGSGYSFDAEQVFDWPSAENLEAEPHKIMLRSAKDHYLRYEDTFEKKPINITTPQPELSYEAVMGSSPIGNAAVQEIRGLLRNTAYLMPVDVAPRSPIRLPQDVAPGFYSYPSGERLFSSLYNLRIQYENVYSSVLDTLRVAFPDFAKLDFPIVASGKLSLYWYDGSSERPFDQSELSEGTLRFLWLLTVLLSPQKPPLILIDEPEISLHPQLLMLLADILKEASREAQIIVATHSDRLIRWLEPENVAVVDKEDGQTSIRWLDSENLGEWLEHYTLDQLWINGHIGGKS